MGKLPSWDADWAKTQFIWGLHGRVAELVTIASPADLFLAIRKAKQVEMARSFAYMGGAQQQPRGSGWRGRGQGARGRFATVQADPQPQAYAQEVVGPQFAAANTDSGGRRRGRLLANQCRKCRGFGHWAFQCPSRGGARGRRGGRRGRGGRGGRGAGNGGGGQGQVQFAALAQSGPEVSGGTLQQPPNAPPVSRGGNAGN